MKYLIPGCLLLLASLQTHAQGYNGLIARWPFNGNTNDVSGNNLHGTANGAVNSTGFNGVANTGIYFNGSSSVTVPYSSLMNTVEYSICAMVRPEQFHALSCQGNVILWRGHSVWAEHYGLNINENTIVNDCNVFDPAAENFKIEFFDQNYNTDWLDTPHVQLNTWYCVVGTYDGDTARIYIDGVLRKSVGHPSAFQPGTSGLSMGGNVFHSQWPNWFTGKMDEVRLYDRPLSWAEANMFCDSVKACPTVSMHPVNDTVTTGNTAIFSITSSSTSVTYQWQADMGLGYVNLSNAGPYSGVTTSTLTISNASMAMNNSYYRCIINAPGCADTSNASLLTVSLPTGVAQVITSDMVLVGPNPCRDRLVARLPHAYSGSMQVFNTVGQNILTHSFNNDFTPQINVSELPAGIYLLHLKVDGQTIVKRFVKE